MRVGLLHAARWLETGRIVGIDSATPRALVEAKLGSPTDYGTSTRALVKYDELEVFYDEHAIAVTPRYVQVDFWREPVARWRDELRFVRGPSRPLCEALCDCDLAQIVVELRVRGLRVLTAIEEDDRRALVDVGDGVTIAFAYARATGQPTRSGAIFSGTRDEFTFAWEQIESPAPRRSKGRRRS